MGGLAFAVSAFRRLSASSERNPALISRIQIRFREELRKGTPSQHRQIPNPVLRGYLTA